MCDCAPSQPMPDMIVSTNKNDALLIEPGSDFKKPPNLHPSSLHLNSLCQIPSLPVDK